MDLFIEIGFKRKEVVYRRIFPFSPTERLRTEASVADDGVIEGIESTRHRFVLGVQWHPEVLAPRQKLQRRIFSSFVACCQQLRGRANRPA